MSINLTKNEFKSNYVENQKELQKAILKKNNYIVNITDYENNASENDNCIKTGINYIYVSYQKNVIGVKFLKNTLKKIIQFDNFSFKDFTKQEIIDYLQISTNDILKDMIKN